MKSKIQTLILHIILIFLGIVWVLPLVWTYVSALKPNYSLAIYDITKWFIPPFTLQNFVDVFNNSQADILRWVGNSAYVSIIATFGVVILALSAAYAFSRFRFPGQTIWFWIVMAGMMVPFESTLIPNYIMFRNLSLLNTHSSLILPALGSSMGVLILKQFIDGLPESLFDAAKLDGCSSLRILFVIVIPLTKAAISSLLIFTFLQRWNDFLWPYIAITKNEIMTIPAGIIVFHSQQLQGYGMPMAANALAIAPMIIVYFIFQKNIVKGIALSGIKE